MISAVYNRCLRHRCWLTSPDPPHWSSTSLPSTIQTIWTVADDCLSYGVHALASTTRSLAILQRLCAGTGDRKPKNPSCWSWCRSRVLVFHLCTVHRSLVSSGSPTTVQRLSLVTSITLQLNRLYPCPLQIWNSQHMILFLASPSFVLKNGRVSGIVARAINFTLSTQLWVLLNTIKFALAVRRWLSTDFD